VGSGELPLIENICCCFKSPQPHHNKSPLPHISLPAPPSSGSYFSPTGSVMTTMQHFTLSTPLQFISGFEVKPPTYDDEKNMSGSIGHMYVSQSALQYASASLPSGVVVWVTDTRTVPPAAVPGAKITHYSWNDEYSRRPFNVSVTPAACTTGSDGTCLVPDSWRMAIIEAPGFGPLLVNGASVPQRTKFSRPLIWMALLVLDRVLVQPGDAVHITGRWFAGRPEIRKVENTRLGGCLCHAAATSIEQMCSACTLLIHHVCFFPLQSTHRVCPAPQ